ncbi:unnamed protein product [Bursaphelenchus xylophilus]|uniref:(pine wood nematode) hypothetical protein n=1 Tax=Bursaphelenchus xylophilus TaxID=6326 RepID=A0A1I7S569_BURXY|nr:unnamed protein product [Bursaphelenchus xylophilus]CAG9117763.1 unnamed protein product [Bursaphelenchus xylophilus]
MKRALLVALLILAVSAQNKEKEDDKKPSKVMKDEGSAPMSVKIMDQVDKALEQPERFLDVREFIRSALDMMRTVPAPDALKKIPNDLQRQQLQEQYDAYAQRQRQNYYPSRAYSSRTYSPYQQQQQYSQYGPKPALPVQPESSDPAKALSRIFATPTQQDMESLFHLPADIMHRLAADAGYIPPHKEPEELAAREGSKYGSSPSSGGFNFGGSPGTFSLGGTSDQDLNSFIARYRGEQPAAVPEVLTTPEPTTAIPVASPPKIVLRTIQKNGKLIQVPVLVVPQANGQTRYIQYDKLSDLSDALAKVVSTGQLPLNQEEQPESTTPRVVNAQFEQPKGGQIFNFPENLQIEPPTTAPPPAVRTETAEGSSFVQQFDVESNENKDAPAEEVSEPVEHRFAPTARTVTAPSSNASQPSAELLELLEKLGKYRHELDKAASFLRTTKGPEVIDGMTKEDDFPRPHEMKVEVKDEEIVTPKAVASAEKIAFEATEPTTTSTAATTTQSAGEILLNGHRYKLVDADDHGKSKEEVTEIPTTTAETSTLKSVPHIKPQKISMKSSNLEQVRNLARQNRLRTPTIRKALPGGFSDMADPSNPSSPNPEHRIYSLRELEDIIASETGRRYDDSDEVSRSPRRPLTSQQLLSAGRVTSSNRADLLRQEYGLEKSVWRERTRGVFRNFKMNDTSLFDQQCAVCNDFAGRFYIEDLSSFAKENCDFVEDFIPINCFDLAEFYNKCEKKALTEVTPSSQFSTTDIQLPSNQLSV